MSISLTAHWQKFVEQMISSGRYNNQSEVIRAGLRALEERELARDLGHFDQIFRDGSAGEPESGVIARTINAQRSGRNRRR